MIWIQRLHLNREKDVLSQRGQDERYGGIIDAQGTIQIEHERQSDHKKEYEKKCKMNIQMQEQRTIRKYKIEKPSLSKIYDFAGYKNPIRIFVN